jgi:hypothetical protein
MRRSMMGQRQTQGRDRGLSTLQKTGLLTAAMGMILALGCSRNLPGSRDEVSDTGLNDAIASIPALPAAIKCAPDGVKDCEAGRPRICRKGVWESPLACAPEKRCVAGECLDPVAASLTACREGNRQCSRDGDVERCDRTPAGTGWSLLEDCGAKLCADGACAPCSGAQRRCRDAVLEECKNNAYTLVEDCASANKLCDPATLACVAKPPVTQPSTCPAPSCLDSVSGTCHPNGWGSCQSFAYSPLKDLHKCVNGAWEDLLFCSACVEGNSSSCAKDGRCRSDLKQGTYGSGEGYCSADGQQRSYCNASTWATESCACQIIGALGYCAKCDFLGSPIEPGTIFCYEGEEFTCEPDGTLPSVVCANGCNGDRCRA